ncbi:MAG: iron-sulfur cluster biosynthesis family protein [Thermoanaerobaculia bacterium]
MSPNISITPEASARLQSDLQGGVLRISFTTGCGGSGYRIASSSAPLDEDVVVEVGEVVVALDQMAARNLDGAEIVYDEEESGYSILHPNAVSAVWCG